MNNRKSNIRSRRQPRQIPSGQHTVTNNNESATTTQQSAYVENNSLLFTQILSGLVWNG